MDFKWLVILAIAFTTSTQALASLVGISSFPLTSKKNILSGSFTNIVTEDGGMGLEGRYTHKYGPRTVLDGGLAISGGDRVTSKFFLGMDYEVMPDYMKQPKGTLKFKYENTNEFNATLHNFSVSPTVSKGFSFWGHEAYPYVATPVGISLHSASKSYETTLNLNLGITGMIPVDGYRHMIGNIETTFSLKDSYTAISMGVSIPISL